MKICSACNVRKRLSEFSGNKSKKDGKSHDCKACHKQYCQVHYKSNKSRYLKRNVLYKKERTENLRKFLTEHPCVDCGIEDIRVLEFDHIKDKTRGISQMLMLDGSSWESISTEISKCEVVCANCHRIRTYSRVKNCWRN